MMHSLFKGRVLVAILGAAVAGAIAVPAIAASAETAHHGRSAAEIVAALDTAYQAAVKHNDARTIDRILDDDFVLSTGSGGQFLKAGFVDDAKTKVCTYEHQEEVLPKDAKAGTPIQTVRVYGSSTAVVTAELWEKGTCINSNGSSSAFDSHLWFSDTYTFRHGHWGYSFGQSSLKLPPDAIPGGVLALR